MEKRQAMLIADDGEMNLEILKTLFEDNYQVFTAIDGLKAVDILNQEKVDIVLLDIEMPNMDGFGVLRYMKGDDALKDIPVVVTTAEYAHERRALIMGADDFVSKPIDPVVVKKRVENIVVKNVLEREKLKAQLVQTELELKSLAATVPGGIVFYKLTDQVQLEYCNDAFCALYGYERDEFFENFAADLMTLVYEEDKPLMWQYMKKALDENQPIVDFTYRVLHKDGRNRWLRARAVFDHMVDGVPTLRAVAMDVTDAKENELLVQKRNRELRYALEHDRLTGLYNRETFYQRAASFLAASKRDNYAIILYDIHNFKIINEFYGSDVGDELLKLIAEGMRERVDSHGIYGRIEGDHFVACLPDDRELQESLRRHIEEKVATLQLGQQIGLYYGIYPIRENMSVDLMCDRASLALRTVKGSYTHPYAVYDEKLHQMVLDEQQMNNEMDSALAQDQFEVYLQPVFTLDGWQTVSAEALVRWNHPVRGQISPGLFIPFFEHNGFIIKLDAYLREVVCRYLRGALDAGQKCVPISVNLSRLELYDPHICEGLCELVEKYKLEPKMLRLEITESAYTVNPEQLLTVMEQLQKSGFTILMDDFGSGYSSLNMLRDIPVNMLKLDMRFLSESEKDVSGRGVCIIKSVVTMAETLGIPVIAEGIETSHQVEFLKGIGCKYGQGYLYARPMPISQFVAKLNS